MMSILNVLNGVDAYYTVKAPQSNRNTKCINACTIIVVSFVLSSALAFVSDADVQKSYVLMECTCQMKSQ